MKHQSGGVLRRRKCFICEVRFSTLESIFEVKKLAVLVKPIYTPTEAAKIKADKVAARRAGEDIQTKRRDRVSMYYIEDEDFNNDKWGI